MLLGAFAVLLGLLTAWPMYQYLPNHNAVFPRVQRVQWTRKLGGKINGGLAIAGGVIFVESFDRYVTALNATTGRVMWRTRLPNIIMTTPIVADGVVIIGTGTNETLEQSATRVVWGRQMGDFVIALREGDGRLRWSVRTVGENMPSPALTRIGSTDAIVFANGDNHVRALAVADGGLIWERAVDGIATMSSAAAHNGRIFVIVGTGAHSGKRDRVLAVGAQTGRMAWSAPYGNADCSPTVAYGDVFVEGSGADAGRSNANGFNTVAAVDERSGRLHWQWFSGYGSFTTVGSNEEAIAGMAAGGAFYESIPATKEFAAFNAGSGRLRWKIRTSAPVKMSAVEFDGRLYFGDTGRTWYVVNAATGGIVKRTHFPSYFTTSSPVILGRTLYVANNATLYAMKL